MTKQPAEWQKSLCKHCKAGIHAQAGGYKHWDVLAQQFIDCTAPTAEEHIANLTSRLAYVTHENESRRLVLQEILETKTA